MDKSPLFKPNRLVSIDDVDAEDIHALYLATTEFRKILERPVRKVPALKELTIANLFFEDSTRTRLSFELAEKRLGADIVNFSASSSSLKKGETLNDTIQNIVRMKVDVLVVRHNASGAAHFIHKKAGIPVVNAGDGTNEHPTQALLDLFTLWDLGLTSDHLKILLKGDILHSRVAGSSIKLWRKLGINFEISGPRTVMRQFLPVKESDAEEKQFNVIYNLRIQKERMEKELIPSTSEYNQYFGTTRADLQPGMYYMHPGPINRGVELDSEIADSQSSLILNQVEMGLAMRMAILYYLGQKKEARRPL